MIWTNDALVDTQLYYYEINEFAHETLLQTWIRNSAAVRGKKTVEGFAESSKLYRRISSALPS